MEMIEKNPLPQRCLECEYAKEGEAMGLGVDAYCYNCDYQLDRYWIRGAKIPWLNNIDENGNPL